MDDICNVLKSFKNIAVVGISGDEERTSNQIAKFLVAKGFNVTGVNPYYSGSRFVNVYNSLSEIPELIEIVNVFRRSELIAELIPDVLKLSPKVLWLQQGIRNDEAVAPALAAGIKVIQDKCIAVYYSLCQNY